MKLTNSNWKAFASLVASPSDATDYNEAAVKRLMEFLDPYVVDIKGVKPKYKPLNRVEIIEFATVQEAETYHKAYTEYLARKAEIEGLGYSGSQFDILVQLMVFQKKAELIRAPEIARRMYNIVNGKGRSAVCGCKYKDTIAKVTDILLNDYNIPRDDISLIWGGRSEAQRKKKKDGSAKLTPEQKNQLRTLFDGDDLDFLKDMGIDIAAELIANAAPKVEDKLRLGIQSKTQRQSEIDRFQSDTSKYCIFTFKAGGVGLSLHQVDEHHRVRESIFAPTYSAIELVQGLCRAHRITSESVTEQTLLFYADTIEVAVAQRVSQKLKCLRHVVRKREDWSDVILGGEMPEERVKVGVLSENEEDDILGLDDEESEEEDSGL